jgi:hypothetical protein
MLDKNEYNMDNLYGKSDKSINLQIKIIII